MEQAAGHSTYERLSERILDSVPVPISYVDADLVYRQVNRAAATALGKPQDRILGRQLAEIVGPDSEVYRAVAGVLETGRAYARMLSFAPPDDPKNEKYFVVAYTPDVDEHGSVCGVFAEGFDVSEQMASIEAAREQIEGERRQLDELLDTLPVGVALVDADGAVLYINRANEAVWAGRLPRAQDIAGYEVYQGFHVDTGEPMRAEDWPAPRVILTGEAVVGELVEIRRLDGTRGYARISAVPIGEPEKTRRIAVVTEDATDEVLSRRLSDALDDVNAVVHSTLDFDEIMQQTLDRAVDAVRADYGSITLLDGGEWVFRYEHGYPERRVGQRVPYESLNRRRRAVETRSPLVEDVVDESTWNDEMRRYEVRAFVVAPLTIRDEIIGALTLDFRSPQYFTATTVDFAGKLAASASLALENARLFNAEVAARHTTDVLADVSALLGATLTPDQALGDVLRQGAEVLHATGGSISERVGKGWRVLHSYGTLGPIAGETYSDEQAPGLIRLLRTGKPHVVPDVATAEDVNLTLAEQRGYRALLAFPLVFRGEVIGALAFTFAERRTFAGVQLNFVDRLAFIISAVRQNARLFEMERRTAAELQESLNAVQISEQRFRATFDQAAVGMAHVDLDGRWLEVNERLPEILGYPLDELLRLKSQDVTYAPDLDADLEHLQELLDGRIPGYSMEKRYVRKDGSLVWAQLTVSLVRRSDGSPDYFVSVIEDISARKQAEARLRESKELSDALNGVDAAINSTLEFDEIMQRVLDTTAAAVHADSAVIFLNEENGWIARYVTGLPRGLVGRRFEHEDVAFSLLASSPGQAVILRDPYTGPPAAREFASAYGVRSLMGVALSVGSDIIGDFVVNYHSSDKRFRAEHADFFANVAASVTLAVRNARMYMSERAIADTLQHALLAVPEQLPHVRFGRLYRSATEAADVGGDFYDLFELDGGRIGILLGDVSGKGIQAATVTALVKNTLRAYAYDEVSPGRVLAKTNDVVVLNTPVSIFITLLYATLEIDTGILRYGNAGHPTPFVKRGGARVDPLEQHGTLLGAFAGVEFGEAQTRLAPGDILVSYTDGATEARQPGHGELLGEERLRDFVAHLRTPVVELPNAIYECVLAVEYLG